MELARERQTSTAAVTAGVVGNVLEWFDFGVYSYFAAVIGKLFFPGHDPLAQLMSSFAVFAVGFFFRPLGALIFGHYGDRAGRRNALAVTVIMMAVATFAIGVMPTYDSIGVLAPILLVVARLVQGLSAGGEWGGSTSFIVEYAAENRRGYIGSFQQVSTGGGFLLGSLTAALVTNTMPADAVASWGWRIPFILGIVVGAVGLYMRLGLPDTPKFREVEERGEVAKSPLVESLSTHFKDVARAFGFTVLWTVAFYVMLTFMPSYLNTVVKLPLNLALISNTIQLLFFIIMIPVFGALSDRYGRKPFLIASAVGFLVFTYPVFILISSGNFVVIILCQMFFALILAFFSGAGPAAIAEIFPTRLRYSSLSVGYNISVMAFGGTAPFIATWLISVTGNPMAPTFYVIAAAIITLFVHLSLKETYKEALK